jgi:hypothetical protein
LALPWARPVSGRGRPRIKIPYNGVMIVLEAVAAVGLIAMLLYTILKWPALPGMVYTRFSADGVAEALRGKNTLLSFPILATIAFVGLTLLRRAPWGFNYAWLITEENAEKQYGLAVYLIGCLKLEVVLLLGYIQWQTIQTAQGIAGGLGPLLLPITIMMIVGTFGIYLYLSHRNR